MFDSIIYVCFFFCYIEFHESIYLPIKLTSNDFFLVDLRVFLTGTVTAGAETVFLPDRVRRAPSI